MKPSEALACHRNAIRGVVEEVQGVPADLSCGGKAGMAKSS
jgi:hypothetical protein